MANDRQAKRQRSGVEESDIAIKAACTVSRKGQNGATGSSEDDDLLDGELPSDTEAALHLLKQQYPLWSFRDHKPTVPIVLKSQLYTVIKDRTIVDRELDDLRLRNRVRVFKLLALVDEYALVLTSDYLACLHRLHLQALEDGVPEDTARVFEWFGKRVLPRCLDVSLPHHRLVEWLYPHIKASNAGKIAAEGHLTLLLQSGALTRHSCHADVYVLAVPGAGPVIKSILKGRKDVLAILGRRRYREMPERELLTKRLPGSLLDMRFHLRDLLGSGALACLQTPSGLIIRLVQQC